jgi:hypothetical protein
MGMSVLPEPPFWPDCVTTRDELDATAAAATKAAETVEFLLAPEQRSTDLTIDAIRTITRAKVTRDSLSLVMSGYAREIAENKTPAQRGLLDEKQVQHTAHRLSNEELIARRLNHVVPVCGATDYYFSILDQIVVLFLSRMGVDQASRGAISALSDVFVSKMNAFAQLVKREMEGNSTRPFEQVLGDALMEFGVANPADLTPWYEVNVVQYAEQMLQSELTLKQRIIHVEAERQKRQDVLQQFLATHATEGTELSRVHKEMNAAQQAMILAQRQYYEAKGKNLAMMNLASANYAKAQEAFKKHAKFIQNQHAVYEANASSAALTAVAEAPKIIAPPEAPK